MKIISVGIVTYNSSDKILALLESIYLYSSLELIEVFVIDNNSSDNTVEIVSKNYPQVRLIKLDTNNGFGHGHNQILNCIESKYHSIINPDIIFKDDILNYLSKYLDENPDISMVTPKILNVDNTEQHLPKKNPSFKYLLGGRFAKYGFIFSKWRAEYTYKDKEINAPLDIDFCTGCFMFLRTDDFKKLNGFDERFFMYFEDADLTRRIKTCGRTVYNPDFAVIHEWERASSKSMKFFRIQLSSMFKYFAKWWGKPNG